MARLFMGALVFCACGKVAEAPDARPIDAPLDAFSCAAPKTECAAACVDTSSDDKNCGGCGITCSSGTEKCEASVCVDTAMTCADLFAASPNSKDGQYTLLDGTVLDCDFSGGTCAQMYGSNNTLPSGSYTKNDGTTIDCDMNDGGLQIVGVAYGQFNIVTTGYQIISLVDFQNAALQQIFIKYFNAQNGASLIAAWSAGDCCFRYDSSADNLIMGANLIEPATVQGVNNCLPPPDVQSLPFAAFELGLATPAVPPLGSNFFALNPPGGGTNCTTLSSNPGFFWKVMQ